MMSQQNDWKTKSKETVYDNPWIRVEHHEVITPGGTDGIYGKIHFKNLAIGIIPIDEHDNTWLVGQYRYTLDEYSWEIPMGGGPLDIDPLLSAQRELQEETGISAQSWEVLMKIHTSNSVTDETGYIYIATDLSYGETEHEDTENIKIKKLPLTEAIDMIHSGEITDAITIAGILRYARHRANSKTI